MLTMKKMSCWGEKVKDYDYQEKQKQIQDFESLVCSNG